MWLYYLQEVRLRMQYDRTASIGILSSFREPCFADTETGFSLVGEIILSEPTAFDSLSRNENTQRKEETHGGGEVKTTPTAGGSGEKTGGGWQVVGHYEPNNRR